MRRMESVGLLLALVLATSGFYQSASGQKEKKEKESEIAGNWSLIERTVDGEKKDEGVGITRLKVAGRSASIVLDILDSETVYMAGTFVLRTDKSPKEIDIEFVSPDDKDKKDKRLGIYKIEKDTLTIGLSGDAKNRPKAFESKKGSDVRLLKLKKLKE